MSAMNSATAVWDSPRDYWEQRASQFASKGDGLKAVCSYGMPWFYNRAIDITQRRVLLPWVKKTLGKDVLDLGCGVGRWSRLLAAHGARVTGLDLSPKMINEAVRRADEEGLSAKCDFMVGDLTGLDEHRTYDYIFVVTVLQHILDLTLLDKAVRVLKRHLAPYGNIVLLEAAPTNASKQCDTAVFKARTAASYLALFTSNDLTALHVWGVDPVPLKTLLLPYYSKLPVYARLGGLAIATGLSLPLDLLFGRHLAAASWHKVFVLGHANELGALKGDRHRKS